jgi:replicative DNA helicase
MVEYETKLIETISKELKSSLPKVKEIEGELEQDIHNIEITDKQIKRKNAAIKLMNSTEYLIVLSQGQSFKHLQDRFNQLEGFYNGIGYVFPKKVEAELRQLLSPLNARILKMPLGDGQSFNSLKLSFKSAFFRDKLMEKELELFQIKVQLGLEELTEASIETSSIQDYRKKEIVEALHECEKLKKSALWADGMEKALSVNGKTPQIVSINDRIKSHNELLNLYRGKKYLGLRVKTIEEFNEKLKGLRKLILLAAAPNVGKTALTVQLAQEVLDIEDDACLVYISLEMTSDEIFTRMNLCLSGLDFDTFVLGKEQIENENGRQPLFSPEELRKIEDSTKRLEQIGDRLQIIDSAACDNINSDSVINYIENLKTKTVCKRVIVIIDYLQVWPIPLGLRFSSDIEADKWRIGEIKKIRDAVNKTNQDPVIVISESRKPSSPDEAWGGELSDVMGSARGTYTPDAVLLLCALNSAQLKKLWVDMKMPQITYKEDANEPEDQKDPSNIKGFLAHHGIAICSLKMGKARDGMQKFNIMLAFHFHKNRFAPINWVDIRILALRFEKKANKK